MWYHITLEQVKQRETIIKNDEKDRFLTIRDKQTKRFWKKKLLELFADGYEYFSQLGTGGDHFKESFDARVALPLKEKTKTEFFKKATYNALMSIYGKFVHLRKYYGEDFLTALTKIKPNIAQEVSSMKKTETKVISHSLLMPPMSEEMRREREQLQSQINDLHYEMQSYEEARKGLDLPADAYLSDIKACIDQIRTLENRIKTLEDTYFLEAELDAQKNDIESENDAVQDENDDGYEYDRQRIHNN